MFFVMVIANNKNWGLVLSEQQEGFLTYKEAKAEVDRLYKESSFDKPGGLIVGAFILARKSHGETGTGEIVYSSIRQDGLVCPVCGKQAKLLQADSVPHSLVGKWYVCCEGCYLRTGFYDTSGEAIDVWMKLSGNGGE